VSRLESSGIKEILDLLPHRYPFLLVDRITEMESGVYLKAIKNVTINEPYFIGHFPQKPVMPGVLIIEALAQATGLLAFEAIGRTPDSKKLIYLVGIDNARFKSPVEPGDQIELFVEHVKNSRGIWKFKAQALVAGNVVASADLMCAEKDAE